MRHYCLIFDFSYGYEAGAIDDLIVSNYLMSKMFQTSLNAWSDLGTDLDIQDYKRLKKFPLKGFRNETVMKPLRGRLILSNAKRRETAMMGLSVGGIKGVYAISDEIKAWLEKELYVH